MNGLDGCDGNAISSCINVFEGFMLRRLFDASILLFRWPGG